MNENVNSDFSVETYIKKQENLLVEHIRRLLQADTRITLLEIALQEAYKNNEDLTKQVTTLKTTVDQSINGLKSVTIERDDLKVKADEVPTLVGELAQAKNKVALLQDEIKNLNTKLEVAATDYTVLKQNYNKVLVALDESNKKNGESSVAVLLPTKGKQSKKQQITNAEWVDGEHDIQT